MNLRSRFSLLAFLVLFSAFPFVSSEAIAADQETARSSPLSLDKQLASSDEIYPSSLSQINSVDDFSDIPPGHWAREALNNLIQDYGCISGYPDGTYRGNRTLTRYEFAAALDACVDAILALQPIVESDFRLPNIERLQEEFAAELATLRGRADSLEERTQFLEDHQFSTTTRLSGEVIFNLADTFGGDGTPDSEDETQTTFSDRIRLMFVTSFTGRDTLFTRLTGGNIGNSFADEIGTNEGRFAYDGLGDNDIRIDRLHYRFPIGDNLTTTIMANAGGHWFYADTFNEGLEAGGGGTGALSRFAERNPIYRLGAGGQGIGLDYRLNDAISLQAGYLARGGNNPDEKAGLFNGNFSAMGQLRIAPSDDVRFGLTYLHGYDINTFGSDRPFVFGGTGTDLGNLNLSGFAIPNFSDDTPVHSNSYGFETSINLSDRLQLGGWFGWTNARLQGVGSSDIINYAVTLRFPDLGAEGNFGAIVVGAEPYLTDLDVPGDPDFEDDVPLHIEALYEIQLTDGIAVTPGIIWLTSPNQDSDNDDIFIGTLRTTFSF